MVLTREEFVGRFVLQYWDVFQSELRYKKQRLTLARTQKPEFRYWFTNDFIDRFWSNYVSYQMMDMEENDKTDLLLAYGVDNALDLLRSSNTDTKYYSFDEMIRHIIQSWYDYDYVIYEFLINK